MKKYIKSIALFLSLLMLFNCFSFLSFAEENETQVNSTASAPTEEPVKEWYLVDEQEFTTGELIGEVEELTSLREENVKHFRLSDGTYEAVVYSEPIHRKDENGVWQDIDNTIELDSDAKASKYSTKDSRITFADRFKTDSDLFTLSENGYSISMSLLNGGIDLEDGLETTDFVGFDTPTVNNSSSERTETKFNSLEEAKSINNTSSIVYNNIKKNTNIEYILNGNNVKENIIINAPCESYEYIFQITLDGLYAELDGDVIFIKNIETNQTEYTIPAPYMYDANGNYSYDVSYTLEQVKDEIYLLVVTADAEWINSEERAFPVVVDPTVNSSSFIYDSYVKSTSPSTNYGSSASLWVSDTSTTYIRISLPALPDGATINNAFLYMSYYYNTSTGSMQTAAHRVSSSWNEYSITYNNAPAVGSYISRAKLSASESINSSSPGTARYAIHNLAREWYSGVSANYGVAIIREQSSTATNMSVVFKSADSNYDTPSYISINYTYTLPSGIYAFENAGSNGYWISVKDDNCWADNLMQHEQSSIDPTDPDVFDRSRLFKVTKVSSSLYTIRSMLNNNLSFNIVGDKIVTKEIPSVDLDVPLSDMFYIQWNGDGFIINPNGSSKILSITSTSNNDLSYESDTSTSPEARWTFRQYTGENRHGYSLHSSSNQFVVGELAELKLSVWSTVSGEQTPLLSIEDAYTDYMSLEWNPNTYTALVEFLAQGQIRILCKIYDESMTSFYQGTKSYNILPLREGIYYLQNVQTQSYVTEAGFAPTDGGIVIQEDYHDGTLQQWEITYLQDSSTYVTIQSITNDMYLGVDPDYPSSIVQHSDENIYTSWKLEITDKGNYKITSKAYESSEQVLASSGDYDLTLNTYAPYSGQNTSYRDEWYLVREVISLVNYYDSTFSSSMNLSLIEDAIDFANLVYSRYYHVGIHMDGASIYNSFGIDDCDLGPNTPCTDKCGNCNDHHKNFYRIHNNMLAEIERDNNHIYILWTNHAMGVYCSNNELLSNIALTPGIGYDYDNDGVFDDYYHYPTIVFFNVNSQKKINMSLNLVHEIAHVLGMLDVYNEQGHDIDNATVCVMETFEPDACLNYYEALLNANGAEPFCKACKAKMLEYTSNINVH